MVVVSRNDIVTELLDHRAVKYMDRPPNIVGCEIIAGGLLFAFGRYNDMYGWPFARTEHDSCSSYQLASYAQGLT